MTSYSSKTSWLLQLLVILIFLTCSIVAFGGEACDSDVDHDLDVDGYDLARFLADTAPELIPTRLPDFAASFGIINCSGSDENPSEYPVIGGCQVFPDDNMWNIPIDQTSLHPNSDTYIYSIGGDTPVHPDFGTSWNGIDIGIPFDIIPQDQPLVDVRFQYYDESDPLDVTGPVKPYPVPENPTIEGGSDRHALFVQQGTCILYELYNLQRNTSGQWTAGSGAIWHLDQNEIRPAGYTSADAAGLAILPGLVRYEEVFGDPANHIDPGIRHALRITLSSIQRGYLLPASHSDGRAGNDPNYPPMGLRMRLKADFDMTGFDEPIKVILRAMQTYGVVVADTGSDMYLSGVHDDRWDDDQLHQLSSVRASDFEAVYTGDVISYP